MCSWRRFPAGIKQQADQQLRTRDDLFADAPGFLCKETPDEVQPVRQGPLRQRRQPDLRREETCSSVLDRCLLRRLVDHRRQQAAFTVLQQACEFLQLPLCKPIHLFQHNEVIFHMGDQSIGRIKQLPVEALGIDQVLRAVQPDHLTGCRQNVMGLCKAEHDLQEFRLSAADRPADQDRDRAAGIQLRCLDQLNGRVQQVPGAKKLRKAALVPPCRGHGISCQPVQHRAAIDLFQLLVTDQRIQHTAQVGALDIQPLCHELCTQPIGMISRLCGLQQEFQYQFAV